MFVWLKTLKRCRDGTVRSTRVSVSVEMSDQPYWSGSPGHLPLSAFSDEWLCTRFQKRMRVDQDSACAEDTGYDKVNDLLRNLHAERMGRQTPSTTPSTIQAGGSCPVADLQGGDVSIDSESPDADLTLTELDHLEVWQSTTRFALSDIVQCRHGLGGRCLLCTGREVCDVPVTVYSAYCSLFQGVSHFSSPTAEEARRYAVPSRSLVAGEVEFPALAAMLASAGVSGGDRFLDLGSGIGRAVLAFALIYPACSAAGVEIRVPLHEQAASVASRLAPDVRSRVHLHCGDLFDVAWHEANILFVNSTGFDDSVMSRVTGKLRDVAPGTRVITLSQPLPSLHSTSLKLVRDRKSVV